MVRLDFQACLGFQVPDFLDCLGIPDAGMGSAVVSSVVVLVWDAAAGQDVVSAAELDSAADMSAVAPVSV